MKNICFLVLFLFVATRGFDGHREGLLFGGGLGVSYTTFNQDYNVSGARYHRPQDGMSGLASDLVIGYGLNENTLLICFSKTNWFQLTNIYHDVVTVSNGTAGIGILQYLGVPDASSAPYLFAGLGWSQWSTPFIDNSTSWSGMGISLGVGYEFARHFSCQINSFYTNPSLKDGSYDPQAHAIGFQLNMVALAY